MGYLEDLRVKACVLTALNGLGSVLAAAVGSLGALKGAWGHRRAFKIVPRPGLLALLCLKCLILNI